MRPFFSYYGGKWRAAARRYAPPGRDAIVEPFAGAAGFAVRHNARRVVLVDKDPVIVGVWRYLVAVTPSELEALPDLAPGEVVDDLAVPPEARALIGFWLNRGCAYPGRRASQWMRQGASPGSFWGPAVRRRLASQLEGIRHWEVLEGDYWAAPDIEAHWFVDPPYEAAGRHYRYGSDALDYQALGAWCRTRRGRVVVCEQAGATWLPFRSVGAVRTTRRGQRSHEVVWESGSMAQVDLLGHAGG